MSEPKIPKRPSENDGFVLIAAAEILAPQVLKWSGDPESELPEVVKQVAKVLRYGADGYELAKDLEDRFYYDADVALVEIMDNAMFAIRQGRTWNAWPNPKLGGLNSSMSNFNLPPGCTMNDVDPPEETEEERLERQLEAEDAAYDRWRDEQMEKK